jgi:guanine deaminase
MNNQDEIWMQEALRLTADSIANGGGPFGAVVVLDGEVIGRGHNRVPLDNDPTAHAEMVAIRAACKHVGSFEIPKATIYVNCEPCMMCMGAIYWSRFDRVCYAATAEDAEVIGFDDAMIRRELGGPASEQRIQTQQLNREQAVMLFEHWHQNPHRTHY